MSLSSRRNLVLFLAVALFALVALLGAAWVEGGSVETREIVQPVALPETAR